MLIFKTVKSLRSYLKTIRSQGKTIGFAPTMGALHEGHLSLVKRTLSENDICITSIFVNPTQFNDKKDLEHYPRTFASDVEKLVKSGCHVVFYPEVKEIYPPGLDVTVRKVDFGWLLQTMEAVFRKGHFEGMAQVVKRLLDIVQPHTLYMGQKDYQQFLVVKRMIEALQLPVRLVMCPTIREKDGLAMSSRNVLLSREERQAATLISRTLFAAREKIKSTPPDIVRKQSINQLDSNPNLKTEYFEIVDAQTLQPVKSRGKKGKMVICTAVKAGTVRLIDNILIS